MASLAGYRATPTVVPPRTGYQTFPGTYAVSESDLRSKVRSVMQSLEEKNQVDQCLADILRLVEDNVKNPSSWRVAAFGSALNGTGTNGCDIDVVAYNDSSVSSKASDSRSVLQKLKPAFDQDPQFSVREAVLHARVPILKLRYAGNRDVDLSINNTNPLPNTRLLKAYVDLDPLVSELAVIVKLWSKAWGISGAADGYLSSYAFYLMVIYFLQVTSTGLPCLHKDAKNGAFEDDEEVRQLVTSCVDEGFSINQNLISLFRGFLEFYTNDFRWGSEVISIRLGRRLDANHSEFKQLKQRVEKQLHIEDPFDLPRNLCDVLWGDGEIWTWEGLQTAHQWLRKGSIDEILPQPLGGYEDSVKKTRRRWERGSDPDRSRQSPPVRRWGAGSTTNDRKHDKHLLPRERITTAPVSGHVLEWKNKFGWIKLDTPLDHSMASKNGGRIFISKSDLVGTISQLKANDVCRFHVFADDSGLGAEQCVLFAGSSH